MGVLLRSELEPCKSLCEKCGRRNAYEEYSSGQSRRHKWCPQCIMAWQRAAGRTGPFIRDTCRLEDVIPPRYRQARRDDLSAALVEVFDRLPDDRGLFLWGTPGTGKTHATAAFAKDFYAAGWNVARITYEMLCLRIRDTFKAGSKETEFDVISSLVAADKLIVEDVGTTVSAGSQETDFSLRTFLVLLDQRLEHCRATFVTSNKSIEDIRASFDDRVASRLMQACEVLHLKGEDRRQRGAGGKQG